MFSVSQVSRVLSDWWLSQWSKSTDHSLFFYLSIYAALSLGYIILALFRAIGVVHGGVKSSTSLHASLVESVLAAPLLFFQSSPVGRILNRFTRDVQCVDELLPTNIHNLIDFLFMVASVFIIIGINNPYMLITFPPIRK
jgi:ABC-type multidrug transport system fused ATPase/permease subunit